MLTPVREAAQSQLSALLGGTLDIVPLHTLSYITVERQSCSPTIWVRRNLRYDVLCIQRKVYVQRANTRLESSVHSCMHERWRRGRFRWYFWGKCMRNGYPSSAETIRSTLLMAP